MQTDDQPYEFILRNGTIVDGSGRPALRADVAIRGDRIAAIGDLEHVAGRRQLDVTGLVVAPGFVDVHTHDDGVIIARPEMTAKLTQGVTTVIGGNCGISAAPYTRSDDPSGLLRLISRAGGHCFSATFESYLRVVENAGPAINSAFLTGHTTLRMQVMGADLQRAASESEIAEMRALLEQSLEAGSVGLSTGLFYPPARAASAHEIVEVSRALTGFQAVYATHMRDEGNGVIESLKETLDVGRSIRTTVIVSHHKCLGRQNFGRSVETLAMLERARQQQSVAWDVYPYTAASTVLSPELVAQSLKTVITWCDPYPEFCGCDLEEVARRLACTLADAIARLRPAGALYFMMDEGDVTRILCSSEAMIGSDGLPEDEHPHPRLWGTFPRVLGQYVRVRKALTLEDAVHRMTGRSSRYLQLDDRGLIEVGKYADLCIFDPESVLDAATFEDPIRQSVGIRHVFVNGQIALQDGTPTGARAGRVLRRHGRRSRSPAEMLPDYR